MPDPSRPPATPDPATVAWGKASQHCDKLFEALEALEEAGGIVAAADRAGWTPGARKRAEASLTAAREAIDRQLATLKEKRREAQSTPVRGRARPLRLG
jgi:hypothetical protein